MIYGTDHAIWRRIRLIPFEVTIPQDQQDRQLPAKLRAELPGILAWAVRGCLAWQREGLGAPEAVVDATTGYRQDMDLIGAFLEECCEFGPEAQSTTQGLYDAYKKWCERYGEPLMGKNTFRGKLRDRRFEKKRSNNRHGWRGLRVKANWDPWAELKEVHKRKTNTSN